MGKMIKKKQIAALVLAGTMAMGSSMQAFACMGVYVGKEVSENGSSYIGRSEDIRVGHTKIFTVHLAEDHEQEQFLKMHIDFQCHIQSTHINIHLQRIHQCLETEKSLMQR